MSTHINISGDVLHTMHFKQAAANNGRWSVGVRYWSPCIIIIDLGTNQGVKTSHCLTLAVLTNNQSLWNNTRRNTADWLPLLFGCSHTQSLFFPCSFLFSACLFGTQTQYFYTILTIQRNRMLHLMGFSVGKNRSKLARVWVGSWLWNWFDFQTCLEQF